MKYDTDSLLSRLFEILVEPVNRLLDALFNGCELVIWQELAKFVVCGSLFELSVRFGGIKLHLAFKIHCLGDRQSNILDAHFIGFVDGKRNGCGIVIVGPHHPDGQFGQIPIVNELTQGRSTAPNGKGCIVLLGNVTLVNQPRNNVSSFNGEVIVRTVNVLIAEKYMHMRKCDGTHRW